MINLNIKLLRGYKTQEEKLKVLNTIALTYVSWLVVSTLLAFSWIVNCLTFIIVTYSIKEAIKKGSIIVTYSIKEAIKKGSFKEGKER